MLGFIFEYTLLRDFTLPKIMIGCCIKNENPISKCDKIKKKKQKKLGLKEIMMQSRHFCYPKKKKQSNENVEKGNCSRLQPFNPIKSSVGPH